MNKIDTSKKIESKEDNEEKEFKKEEFEEEVDIEEEVKETKEIVDDEGRINFGFIDTIESKIKNDISQIRTLGSANTIKDIEDNISMIMGWMNNRSQLFKKTKDLAQKEEKIVQEVRIKLSDGEMLLHDKETEQKLRRDIWGPEINKYVKYEKEEEMDIGESEQKHFEQIDALEEEIKNTKNILENEKDEVKIAKQIIIELHSLQDIIKNEISLFNKLKNLLKQIIIEINQGKSDFCDIESKMSSEVDELENLFAKEVHLIDNLPNELFSLQKEDLADQKLLDKIIELQSKTDMRQDY